jgi:hypothetical protein
MRLTAIFQVGFTILLPPMIVVLFISAPLRKVTSRLRTFMWSKREGKKGLEEYNVTYVAYARKRVALA